MSRTAEEFAVAAAERQISRWNIHDCSICNYPCGFVFDDGVVGYDPGCDCTGRYWLEARTWDDVAQQYNMQDHPDVIAKYDAFWGFNLIAAVPEDQTE